MGRCPRCRQDFPGLRFCPRDGLPLQPAGAGYPGGPPSGAGPVPPAAGAGGGPLPDPYLGVRVGGRYRVVGRIGEGGMGAVFRVEDEATGLPRALKLLHRELCVHEHAVHRFEREARSASRLCHPNNIQVLDFGSHSDGSLFLVMEFLEGKDLFDTLKAEGTFDAARSARVIRQVCAGLAEAHDKGIIHRDLKPENIFLIRRPEEPDFVKILDFGIAKVLEAEPGEPTITARGTVFGTPEYLAPEQARGERVDHRADLYSVGVILYRMVCGRLPFWAPNKAAMLHKQMYEPPPPIEQVRPPREVPPDLARIVYRLLEKRPSQRYQTAQEVIAALDEADLRPLAERLRDPRPEAPIVWVEFPDQPVPRPRAPSAATAPGPPSPSAVPSADGGAGAAGDSPSSPAGDGGRRGWLRWLKGSLRKWGGG